MTYQLKQKGLTKVSIYCIGGGLSDIIGYAGVVILVCLYLLEQCLDPIVGPQLKLLILLLFKSF